jgi:hypothetical protein
MMMPEMPISSRRHSQISAGESVRLETPAAVFEVRTGPRRINNSSGRFRRAYTDQLNGLWLRDSS